MVFKLVQVCVSVCVCNLRKQTVLIMSVSVLFFYRKIWDTKVEDPSTR